MTAHCPVCKRTFGDKGAVYNHAKVKHKNLKPKELRALRPQPAEQEESMADRMINAQIQAAMGGPVDEDWLLDCM
jgi:hypothetical protein